MIWLIGMILFALYAAYVWSGAISSLRREYSDVLVYGALGLLILQIFAELGILLWKRWGVYGLIGALLINLVLRLLLGTVDDISVAVFVLAAAMLWWIVRPNWTLYTW